MIEPIERSAPRAVSAMPDREGNAPPSPIPIARLQAMLFDPDVPDEVLRPYLVLDERSSTAFDPTVRVDPRAMQEVMTEAAVAFASVNNIARWRRTRRYRRRAGSWDGPRLVSEGDSWFQFPFLLTDTIDHLADDHLILSLGAAGDLLADMLSQDELAGAVASERPDAVLLSAGGNDLLGAGGLTRILERHETPRDPADYLGATFDAFLAAIVGDYRRMAGASLAARPGAPVICHGYDRAVPAGGRWLGRPMTTIGISEPALQRAVVALMVDRFQNALDALSHEDGFRGRLHVIDARGTVGADEWFDELHPTDGGYGKVAELFRDAIARALRGRGGGIESTTTPPPAAVFAPPDDAVVARAALRLAGGHDRPTLLREAGRRDTLLNARVGAPLAVDLAAVPIEGVEEWGNDLAGTGQRVLDAVERRLFDLLCRADPRHGEARERLRTAVDSGDPEGAATAIAGHAARALGLPPFLAATLVALTLQRLDAANWRRACDAWTMDMNRRAAGVAAPETRGVESEPRHDLVEAGAKRPINGTRRILDALTTADGARPDLSRAARRETLAALRRTLEAKPRAVIRPDAIDRVADVAEGAMRKIAREGEAALLTPDEGAAMEAVIVVARGARPVLYVQDDRVVRDDDAIGDWGGALDHFDDAIANVARAVCRIEAPWSAAGYAGTGFAVGHGLVLTNRHVLEAIAVEDATGRWTFGPGVEVDFAGEKDRTRRTRFPITGVAHVPQPPIAQTIDFARLDLAVLRCGAGQGFPAPLMLEADGSAFDRNRAVYAMGFPARPQSLFGNPDAHEGAIPAGHEFLEVQEALFDATFGVKRWSPGRLMDVPGSLPGDGRAWVVNHDASTLRGSSGSCIVDFAADGARVMGLHFGGRNRTENWAHALHAVRGELAALGVGFA